MHFVLAADVTSWIALAVSAAALVWTIVANRRSDARASESNAISRRALSIAEAEQQERDRERAAKPELSVSVEPGGNHELDDSGAVWTSAAVVITTLVISINNAGERNAGRTVVEVWLPQTATGDAFWANGLGGAEIPDMPKSTPDPSVLLSASATSPTFAAHYLVRTLDQVALGVPERLYVRAPFSVEGEATYPVDVVVRTEGAADAAKVRYVLQIRQRRN